jgi:hypothetical protein
MKNIMHSLGNSPLRIQEKRGEREKYMYSHCGGLQESTHGSWAARHTRN